MTDSTLLNRQYSIVSGTTHNIRGKLQVLPTHQIRKCNNKQPANFGATKRTTLFTFKPSDSVAVQFHKVGI